MGTLVSGPLSQLAVIMAQRFGIKHFIETGTFQGHTAKWAAGVFDQVKTIEINDGFIQQAAAELAGLNNVTLIHGDSASALTAVVTELDGPALFWLDAHSGGGWFGPDDRCALLDELRAIVESPWPHIIFIDDARAFLAPPPPPFKPECWPGLADIVLTLNARSRYDAICLLDALICAPPSVRPLLVQFSAAVRPVI